MATKNSGLRPNGSKRKSKVGSDPAATHNFGGKNDFGIPARDAKAPLPDGGREKGPEQGTGPTRSGEDGVRVDGVAYPTGPAGSGSGGDLDPDVIGLDRKGGLANRVDDQQES